jgi:hypothetical protein
MHGPETLSSETALLAALRCGDEDAFSALVDTYGAAMHRVALTFVRSSASPTKSCRRRGSARSAVSTGSKAAPP